MQDTDEKSGVSAGQTSLLVDGGTLSASKDDEVRTLPIKEGSGWKVKLVCPSGASAALRAFILGTAEVSGAEDAIQNAVDLLGSGTPVPPPMPKPPVMKTSTHEVGEGAINPAYQKTVITARSRQDSLHGMDNQVAGTSGVVADKQHSALRRIKGIVADLNSTLSAFQGRKLSTAQETKLAEAVAHAVELVYDQVTITADENAQLARDPGSTGSTAGIPAAETVAGTGTESAAGTAAGAGSGGGLESILPMLAMLPMAFTPLMGMLPELLNKEGEEAAPEDQTGAPPPEDPTALVPVAGETTVSATGITAADSGQPATLPSLPGLGRNTVSRRNTQQASGGNDTPPTEDDEDVTEPVFDQA